MWGVHISYKKVQNPKSGFCFFFRQHNATPKWRGRMWQMASAAGTDLKKVRLKFAYSGDNPTGADQLEKRMLPFEWSGDAISKVTHRKPKRPATQFKRTEVEK